MSRLIATFDAEQLRDLAALDGLYVGLLGKEEMRLFEDAQEKGLAHITYQDGWHALLGFGKVKIGQQ